MNEFPERQVLVTQTRRPRAAGIHGLEPAFQLLESTLDAGPIAGERVSDNELDGGARNT